MLRVVAEGEGDEVSEGAGRGVEEERQGEGGAHTEKGIT